MEINVSQIDEYDGLTLEHVYPDGEPFLENEEGRLVGQTQLRVRATRDVDEVLLRGEIKATVQFACDRCLVLFPTPVAQDFDLLYVAAGKSRNAHEEHELKEDDLSIAYYEGHAINLDDLVREQIELTLPMTRICKETCRGLCAECGTNLNDKECGCAMQQSDARWDALKKLKLKP
jgi:uncharacterized metal-binding protein YceD (DUF177 family)